MLPPESQLVEPVVSLDELRHRWRAEAAARHAKTMAEYEERSRAQMAKIDRMFRQIRWMLYAAIIMIIILNIKLWSSPLPN